MDSFISAIILAIIQGISEWFPISSSGHLVLFSEILGFNNTLQFDIALHLGTLMAVFVYFGKDITNIVEDIAKGKWKTENSKLGFLLIVSAIPAGIIGLLFSDIIEHAFTNLWLLVLSFGITSLLLFIASLNLNTKRSSMTYKDSFLIGVAQAVSILPGISRSGSTISSGLLLGLDEKTAVKFSFLMSIPVIFGAALLELGSEKLSSFYLLPTIISFFVGLVTIHFLLKILVNSKKNLRWFAIYCMILAIVLLFVLLL
jgi:undecaprenyl-diphosphatase